MFPGFVRAPFSARSRTARQFHPREYLSESKGCRIERSSFSPLIPTVDPHVDGACCGVADPRSGAVSKWGSDILKSGPDVLFWDGARTGAIFWGWKNSSQSL